MAKQWNKPPDMVIDPKKKYKARIDTDKGVIVVDLFAEDRLNHHTEVTGGVLAAEAGRQQGWRRQEREQQKVGHPGPLWCAVPARV